MTDVAEAGAAAIYNEWPSLCAMAARERYERLVLLVSAVLAAQAHFAPSLEPSVN